MQDIKQPVQIDDSDLVNIRTVCLALGPYRNLTTLTASILALHPNCQVLNHAGNRTFANRDVNLLAEYSDEKFNRFIKYAVTESTGGKRGQHGGSILFSHAFDPERKMGRIYKDLYGSRLLKDDIQCLFWKEPLRTANFIRENNVDIDAILSVNDRLRFLMPVRNPMDCAKSSLKSGHVYLFGERALPASVENVLLAIFYEYLWFLDLKARHPSRFYFFFEHEFGPETLADIASFLGVDLDEKWVAASIEAFAVKSPYIHSDALRVFYINSVNKLFSSHAAFSEKLLHFSSAGAR